MRASDESETGLSLLVFVLFPPPTNCTASDFVRNLYEQAVSFGSSSVKAQTKAYIFGIKSGRRRERFCFC